MRSPEGRLYRLVGTYREVVPPKRLVFTHAWLEEDGTPGPETLVTVELDARGKSLFGDLSAALVDRHLVIVLDGDVVSSPKVMEPIRGGRAMISLGQGKVLTMALEAKVVAADILADLAGKERFQPRFRNTCWSLLAPEDSVKIGANYTPKNGRLDPSGSFVSQPGEDAAVRKQNFEESVAWYASITADMFATSRPQTQAGSKAG